LKITHKRGFLIVLIIVIFILISFTAYSACYTYKQLGDSEFECFTAAESASITINGKQFTVQPGDENKICTYEGQGQHYNCIDLKQSEYCCQTSAGIIRIYDTDIYGAGEEAGFPLQNVICYENYYATSTGCSSTPPVICNTFKNIDSCKINNCRWCPLNNKCQDNCIYCATDSLEYTRERDNVCDRACSSYVQQGTLGGTFADGCLDNYCYWADNKCDKSCPYWWEDKNNDNICEKIISESQCLQHTAIDACKSDNCNWCSITDECKSLCSNCYTQTVSVDKECNLPEFNKCSPGMCNENIPGVNNSIYYCNAEGSKWINFHKTSHEGSLCSDGIDNDCDGKKDNEDSDCFPDCSTFENLGQRFIGCRDLPPANTELLNGRCEQGNCYRCTGDSILIGNDCIPSKTDWNNNPGVCRDETRCYCKSDTCPSGYFDDMVPSINENGFCVSSGSYKDDHYCQDGNWTTRTRFIAEAMLNFAKNKDYVLYCDSYDYALTQQGKEKVELLQPQETSNYCILRYDDKIAFGTALNDAGNFLDKILILSSDKCDISKEYMDNENKFQECSSGNKVWYNPVNKLMIYDITGINLLPDSIPDYTIYYIKQILSTLIDFLREKGESYEIPTEFSKIYIEKKNSRTIYGVFNNNPSNMQMSVEYNNFQSDLCSSIPLNLRSSVACYRESGKIRIITRDSDKFQYWQDFTSKLRTR